MVHQEDKQRLLRSTTQLDINLDENESVSIKQRILRSTTVLDFDEIPNQTDIKYEL